MSRRLFGRPVLLCAAVFASASVPATPRGSSADPPPVHLVIQTAGGSSASYRLSEIRRLGISGTDLVVVPRAGAPDSYALDALRSLRTDAAVVAVDPPAPTLLGGPRLFQNRPNPASSGTSITFDLPRRSRVSLEIYEVSGRRILTLADKEFLAGRHEVEWDGTDAGGRRVSAGMYFYRLKGTGSDQSRRMVVLP